MDKITFKFSMEDVGCYIDAAYGKRHAMNKLADMVEPLDNGLAAELRETSPDAEAAEELLDLGCETLNEHIEETGSPVAFEWIDGDLVLGQ